MNCQACQERLIEYGDGKLPADAASEVRSHLESCPQCAGELKSLQEMLGLLDARSFQAPSHRMRARLAGQIESEKITEADHARWLERLAKGPARSRGSWLRPALQVFGACALVALGFIVGERSATDRRLAALDAKVDTMGMLVEQSVLQKRSTVDRIATVMTVGNANKPTERAIDGLINTMAFDPSVNVRLNALNALYSHADQQVVRSAVLACLPREPNPLVQVSMIDFLVAAKARDAAPELKSLSADPKADAEVRESARRAIDLL